MCQRKEAITTKTEPDFDEKFFISFFLQVTQAVTYLIQLKAGRI